MALLRITSIRTDGGTQMRERTDQDTVEEYCEALLAGCVFPPIVVFRDRAGHYWLADGFHRLAAYILAGRKSIEVDLRRGELREAVLHAVGVNQRHGLRRSNGDKRRCVRIMLLDPEWRQWSNRRIADQCGVSPGLVDAMRRDLAAETRSGGAYNRHLSDSRKPLSELSAADQAAAIQEEEWSIIREEVERLASEAKELARGLPPPVDARGRQLPKPCPVCGGPLPPEEPPPKGGSAQAA